VVGSKKNTFFDTKLVIMKYNMLEFINSLEDPRRGQGMRHQLEDIMVIILMAILSGHQGLRGFARFAKANSAELTEILNLKHGVPCYYTFRTIINGIEEQILADQFISWVKNYTSNESDDFIALDGKSIRSTLQGGNTKLQNFVAVVNAFGHRSGLVYGMESYENGRSGEGQALRDLVKKLGLKDKVFTMDALHSQKNT